MHLPLLFFSIAVLLYSSPTTLSFSAPLLTPITKDPSTLQYTTTIYQKTPLKPTKYVLDLGFSFSWVDCSRRYKSSSYSPIPCNTTLCMSLESRACGNCYEPPKPGCANDTCSFFPENSFTSSVGLADALMDTIAMPTTDGRNPGPIVTLPRYIFSCAKTKLLRGLAQGVSGVLALGRSNYSLPAQVAKILALPNVFALCLSGSPSAPGVAFFGTAGPYSFLPAVADASKFLTQTPLILNPVSHTIITYLHPSHEYFIGVTSIRIDGQILPINSTLLTIDGDGRGGTKISTVPAYTTMETSIYRAFTEAFLQHAAAANISIAEPVKPFKACFQSSTVANTRAGPAVPTVDLVLHKEDVLWRIWGANSMVLVKEDVMCLAFVDGGLNPKSSIVIGGYQLEDNLVQFDLEKKLFGFCSSLLLRETTCANFNFTSYA